MTWSLCGRGVMRRAKGAMISFAWQTSLPHPPLHVKRMLVKL
ncbi:hypothetical protein B4096_3781 [Heyndrickxia coagulans]|nr:hypothetical protein B4096_3781 [Heyndrickxia coagulans]